LASRSGVGDFVRVGTAVDTYVFEDTLQWIYGKSPALHYQVRFTYDGTEYASEVKQAVGNLTGRYAAILREMVRKEELRQQGTGFCGYLYKRRVWGVRCTQCSDWNTGQTTDSHCTTCYGTGFVGGYFDPVVYWLTESSPPASRRKVTDQAAGMVNNKVLYARGLNCPWLDTRDVWVDFDSDRRYVIQTIQDLDYRGVVFVFDPIELRLAPDTDIIYQLPRPEDSSSSSSSSSGSA